MRIADRRRSHRLRDRVDQRGAHRRRLEVAVLLLERGDALLDSGVGLYLCEKATRADGLNQLRVVGAAGLEPARACARQPLKLARLPVPPRPDVINCCYGRAPWLRTEARVLFI